MAFRVLSISHFYLELQHDWEKPALREIKEIIWGKGFVKLNTLILNVAMKLCEFLASTVKIDFLSLILNPSNIFFVFI